jgi:predicted nuclease of restriction endonuclease-like (RecB) superfamily
MPATRTKQIELSGPAPLPGYDALLTDISGVIESAKRSSARAVNALMTSTYWLVGRRIVESEQHGAARADYGKQIIDRLSIDLQTQFGRGFGRRNLFQMRSFYLAYPEILQSLPTDFGNQMRTKKVQTMSAQLEKSRIALEEILPLPWSHYVRLLAVRDPKARQFYEIEARRGGWTIRQLDRQIQTQFFERTALSRDKGALLRKGAASQATDHLTPDEELKDPYVLEFLALKDEYSESDLEAALIEKLEGFLLELGGEFAFIGRQRRLRIGRKWYRVDLLFFHRRLRCLVIVDLKLGEFTHSDAGQMHLYLNYAREQWMLSGENPPVGLILCAEKDHAVAKYALQGSVNKVLTAEYRMALPKERLLVEEIERSRRQIENREHGRVDRGPMPRSPD